MTDTRASRLEVLADLVEHRVPASDARARLAGLPWDEEELLDLELRHVVGVLSLFADGAIDVDEVTAWADTVDLRDDLGRERGRESEINDALFVMSSPELLDEDYAVAIRRLLADLRSAS